MIKIFEKFLCLFMGIFIFSTSLVSQSHSLGLFEDHGDVGNPALKGNAVYNEKDQVYLLSGAGKNIWTNMDQFQFLWRKIKGDFIIKATVRFIGKGVAGHRKIGIMARDKLTTDSRYVDGAFHGGEPLITSLQYRLSDGDTTGQITVSSIHPTEIELERSGNTFIFSAAVYGENYKSVKREMQLDDEAYVGLYICSHIDTVMEKAVFSNVRIIIPPEKNYQPYHDYIGSLMEVMDVKTGHRKIVHTDPGSIQCPNWTRDGKSLIFNSSQGLLYKFNIGDGTVTKINSGGAINNNNDHVLSFDGKKIGISNYVSQKHISTIFTLPITGSDTPTKITSEDSGHSYFHGFSPDGKN